MVNDDIIMTSSILLNYYGSRIFLIIHYTGCLGWGIYFNGEETILE